MPPTLANIAKRQAEINKLIGAGNTFGEIGERVAAKVSGSTRISGTGNDLYRPAPAGWERPLPVGIAAGATGFRVAPTKEILEASADPKAAARALKRYESWVSSPYQRGEVKTRQLDRRFSDTQLMDTRGSAGPLSSFTPLVDFYVFNIFDTSGDLRMCIEAPLAEVVEFVMSDVGRGGAWNYKVSIGLWMELGVDKTDEALDTLRSLEAVPELKGRAN